MAQLTQLEEIVAREKEVLYAHPNKELFSFYVLTLISAEQNTKAFSKRIIAFSLLISGGIFTFLPQIREASTNLALIISQSGVNDLLLGAALCYGAAVALILSIRKGFAI